MLFIVERLNSGMKKTGVLISVALIVAIFLYGYKYVNETNLFVNEFSEETIYYEAYADFIENSSESLWVENKEDEIRFFLIYIDKDDVPELVYGTDYPPTVRILTYKNNKVMQYDIWPVDYIEFYEKSNIIWAYNFIHACGSNRYFSLPEDGGDEIICLFGSDVYQESGNGNPMPSDSFWIESDYVDFETYKEQEKQLDEKKRIYWFDNDERVILSADSLKRLKEGKIQ